MQTAPVMDHNSDTTTLDRLVGLFRALGEPTRLRLLEQLDVHDERTQRELVEAVDATQSRVSEHLAWLRWAGLVSARRAGRTVRYRLTKDGFAHVLEATQRYLDAHPEAATGQRERSAS